MILVELNKYESRGVKMKVPPLIDTTDWMIGILVMQGDFDKANRLIKEKIQKDNAKKDGAKNG